MRLFQNPKIVLINPPTLFSNDPGSLPTGLLAIASKLKEEYDNIEILDLAPEVENRHVKVRSIL